MKKLMLVLLLLPLFSARAWAEDAFDIFDADAMRQGLTLEERAVGGELSRDGFDAVAALSRLWQNAVRHFRARFVAEFGFAAELLVLVFLCGAARTACPSEKIAGLIEICSASLAAGLLLGGVNSLVEETVQALYRLSDYSKAALPVVYAAAAASGAPGSASARYAASALALDMILSLSQKLVIPLIYALLSLTLTNAVFPHPILGAVEGLVRWMAKTAMTASSLAFTICLGICSVVSGSVDAAALKAARSVIAGAVPVVGGMVADASAAVLSAAAVVRSCTGAFGLVTVCAMVLGPFAALLVKNTLFKSVAAVAESVQNPRLQKLFSGVGNAVALLMGLLGSTALMLLIAIAAGMKAAGA
ncbi:MAG: hypothetical protein IJT29_02955 [Oscillospiraceae bacterium]|nr:hypothetical protein [Oscillospiraceae bacterium]